jgi:hypothetical protein
VNLVNLMNIVNLQHLAGKAAVDGIERRVCRD